MFELTPSDNRKFKLAVVALALITVGWITSGANSVLNDSYSELVTGVMGVLVLYYTGNVGAQLVAGKYKQQTIEGGDKP